MSLLLYPILTASSLISYASKKHTDRLYNRYYTSIGAISYIDCLRYALQNSPSIHLSPGALLIAPLISTGIRMTTGYIIGKAVYDCMN